MKKNLVFFICLLVLAMVISYTPVVLANTLRGKAPFLSFVFNVISYILGVIVQMGLIKVSLGFCDAGKSNFGDLFAPTHLFFKFFFGSILYFLIVVGGLILLIVPGIIWAIKFQFYNYLIIDRGLGPIEALKKSAELTEGVKWDLLAFDLTFGIINVLGALCLVVGLFATVPTTMIAMASVYRKLAGSAEISPA